MTSIKSTREKIADAAIELFVAKGVAETSMRDIAKEIGVTEAALYRHFTGKDNMVWTLFQENYQIFTAHVSAALNKKRTQDKIFAMVEICCQLFDQNRDVFFFLLFTQHIQRLYPKNYQPKLPLMIEAVIADGIKNKEIPQQDSALSTAMMMGIVLQTAASLLYKSKKSLSQHQQRLSQACWQILKTGDKS